MGGHGHAPETPKVPDWKTYCVEDVPELVELRKNLNACGLKSPWLRNEVWRFTEYYHKYPGTTLLWKVAFSGFKYGLVAAIITTAIEKGLTKHDDHH